MYLRINQGMEVFEKEEKMFIHKSVCKHLILKKKRIREVRAIFFRLNLEIGREREREKSVAIVFLLISFDNIKTKISFPICKRKIFVIR